MHRLAAFPRDPVTPRHVPRRPAHQGGDDTDHQSSHDVLDVVDVRRHPGSTESNGDDEQHDAPAAPVGQDQEGHRGRQRRVVRREPVVGRMREQRLEAGVDDERARVGVDGSGHLHEDGDDQDRHHGLHGQRRLLPPRQPQPDDAGAQGDREQGVLRDGGHQVVHVGIVSTEPERSMTPTQR